MNTKDMTDWIYCFTMGWTVFNIKDTCRLYLDKQFEKNDTKVSTCIKNLWNTVYPGGVTEDSEVDYHLTYDYSNRNLQCDKVILRGENGIDKEIPYNGQFDKYFIKILRKQKWSQLSPEKRFKVIPVELQDLEERVIN
jgi:hypothetical protein